MAIFIRIFPSKFFISEKKTTIHYANIITTDKSGVKNGIRHSKYVNKFRLIDRAEQVQIFVKKKKFDGDLLNNERFELHLTVCMFN